jgi:hypothetical protein
MVAKPPRPPIAPVDQRRLNREQDHDGEHRASDDDEGDAQAPVHFPFALSTSRRIASERRRSVSLSSKNAAQIQATNIRSETSTKNSVFVHPRNVQPDSVFFEPIRLR